MSHIDEAPLPRLDPKRRKGFWIFIALMLALTGVFVGLGKWQLDRLAWKQGLIAEVSQRMHDRPVQLPASADWSASTPDALDYRPVSVTGHFINDQAILVFTSLDAKRGRYGGPGYWVMTPFAIDRGGIVFVNRGFIPSALAPNYRDDAGAPRGTVTISGIARAPEGESLFTPAPDPAKRIDYARDPRRLARMLTSAMAPVVPVYIDLPAGPANSLPQGGGTVIDFPNNHLGYAMTWFGFALLTPLMLAVWIYKQFHPGFEIMKYL